MKIQDIDLSKYTVYQYQRTINSLREIADVNEKSIHPFSMTFFITPSDEIEKYIAELGCPSKVSAITEDLSHECGSAMCLLGNAGAYRVGFDLEGYDYSFNWGEYSKFIMPVLPTDIYTGTHWGSLFGDHLPSILENRVKSLRDYADGLESKLNAKLEVS